MANDGNLNRQWKELEQRIQFASSFVITTHQNPDADGLGSELALYYILKKLGKEVFIFNISPTPESLRSRTNLSTLCAIFTSIIIISNKHAFCFRCRILFTCWATGT